MRLRDMEEIIMAEAKGQTDSCRGYFDVDGSGAMTELIFLLELSGPMADLELAGWNVPRRGGRREDFPQVGERWKRSKEC